MSNDYCTERCAKCGVNNLIDLGNLSDETAPDIETFRCYACGIVCRMPDENGNPCRVDDDEDQDSASTDGMPVPRRN